MADHYLEPTQSWGAGDHFLFPDPNPALAQILIGPGVHSIVSDSTAQVLAVYVNDMESRPRVGDRHPGQSLRNTTATVDVGGYKNDRFVGEIHVAVDYAQSDEHGRKNPTPGQKSTTPAHHALTTALYSVLPQRI